MDIERTARKIICGQCFPWAYRFQKNNGGILVHGMVTHPWDKNTFPHAWVVKGGKVYDWQTVEMRKSDPLSVQEFMKMWKPRPEVEFDKDESMFALAHTHHYGPWTKEDAKSRVSRDSHKMASDLLKIARLLVSKEGVTDMQMLEAWYAITSSRGLNEDSQVWQKLDTYNPFGPTKKSKLLSMIRKHIKVIEKWAGVSAEYSKSNYTPSGRGPFGRDKGGMGGMYKTPTIYFDGVPLSYSRSKADAMWNDLYDEDEEW